MTPKHDVIDRIRAALRSEARIRDTGEPIRLSVANGDLLIEGEVDHIAGKRLALEAAARVFGAGRIIDRLHVRPATAMGDGAIRDGVRDALLEETVLADCSIGTWSKGQLETVREPADATGSIEIKVEDGVVTLDGDVIGLGEKRLAGVLAWWVPGSRDVVNGLGVTPPDVDNDDAITDAVRQVIERDPLVTSAAIETGTRNAVVTLLGSVPSDAERSLAAADAWYVFGVDDVVNKLDVQP
ncbi:MAG TPA: BON domain-containing protein [Acetobacteraceae bacterium]|nr:BON domain-containing protein [Acetobacteraceae bacterium]